MTYSAFLDILFAMYVVGMALTVIYFFRVLHPRRWSRDVTGSLAQFRCHGCGRADGCQQQKSSVSKQGGSPLSPAKFDSFWQWSCSP